MNKIITITPCESGLTEIWGCTDDDGFSAWCHQYAGDIMILNHRTIISAHDPPYWYTVEIQNPGMRELFIMRWS